MLQKIENLVTKAYFYIKKHFSSIVIWFLVLTTLFLLGDRFGWNESISKQANDLFGYLNTRKTIAVNLVLAIGSTISAIFAVVIAIRANKISKIALESERPVLVADYLEKDTKGNEDMLKIRNEGMSDAINIRIYLFNSKKDFVLLSQDKNLCSVPKAGDFNLEVSSFGKKQSYIIFYENSLNGSHYKYGFDIVLGSNCVKPIGSFADSPVDYSFYQSFQNSL